MSDWPKAETPTPSDPLVSTDLQRSHQRSWRGPFDRKPVAMSTAGNQQQTFPAIPPSHSAGDHEMRDYYADPDVPRPSGNQAPYLTPYLGLRARLSQIWVNRWTILLLLVLVRTLIAIASIDDNLGSARKQALSACTGVESMGTAMASLPHYMAQGVNELTATGIEKSVNGLYSMLTLSVTAVEELVVFVINLLTSTYVCLITLAVSGSLHVALDVIEDVSDFLNNTLGDIGDSIQSTVGDFQDSLNDFADAINSIPDFFGSDSEVPELDISGDLDRLDDLQLPSSLDEGLRDLNDSIPTFEQVQNFTNNAIRFPFEKIKDLINGSIDAFEFNRSVFPVPEREQMKFCSENDGINDFFDNLVDIAHLARKIFIAVLVILAILVCVPMAWREIKRWRLMQQRAQLVNKHAFDPMDVIYISSRPYSSTIGIKLANRFRSVRNQTAVRWAVAYATSTPALFVLSLGVAGLFACLCQLILLRALEKQVPELSNEVGQFAERVVTSLNNASESWALETNALITDTNNDINREVLGWAVNGTDALNDTLNTFVDGMTDVLNDTFGGTVLYDPITEVLNCLILIKIEGIQRGLTWVHDHAHVDFPLLPNDTFSLGAAASLTDSGSDDAFLANPDSVASDQITAAVVEVIDKIEEGIRIEAFISGFIVLVWVILVFIGIGRAVTVFASPGKTRAEGGPSAYRVDPETDNMRGGHLHDVIPASAAPPYEYHDSTKGAAAPADPADNPFEPRAFPTYGPGAGGADTGTKIHDGASRDVGVAVTRPVHLRSSSHGDLGGVTPVDEKSGDPFGDRNRV
ncbi:hypothetical protein BDY21DRAFT_163392 [Lineolata rhizophorae]|uniref:Plasma membrane fusion protein PRM1 n=1 Tax=Lineolata rhizophorae TaxID=578093 RepID=A0A6A6P8W7_9PEZI|nr:hypothetical protein BDY21DRAFT_163392 [Lineolata rhizophorae]